MFVTAGVSRSILGGTVCEWPLNLAYFEACAHEREVTSLLHLYAWLVHSSSLPTELCFWQCASRMFCSSVCLWLLSLICHVGATEQGSSPGGEPKHTGSSLMHIVGDFLTSKNQQVLPHLFPMLDSVLLLPYMYCCYVVPCMGAHLNCALKPPISTCSWINSLSVLKL